MPTLRINQDESGHMGITPEEPITQIMIANILNALELSTEKTESGLIHKIIFNDGTKAIITIENGKYTFSALGTDEKNLACKVDEKYRLIVGEA